MTAHEETLFEFPCEFSIKAMGKSSEDFSALVSELVGPFLHGKPHHSKSQSSGKGRFTSVTVTFTAESKAQLDDIYMALTSHERMLYVL